MDKREAYRICHVYPDRELNFSHEVCGVIFSGVIRRLNAKDIKTYYPFTVETSGIAKLKNGNVTLHDISRRYVSIEDAVVHIYNGLNENSAVRDKYHSLEDILFE